MSAHAIVLERFAEIDEEAGYEAVLEVIAQRVSSTVSIVSTEERAVVQVSDRDKQVVLDLDTDTGVVNEIEVGDMGVVWRVDD